MDDLSLLYESVLITEMNDKVVRYLNQHLDGLPFDNIFGDDLRIVIPIGEDLTAQEIVNDIKRIKDFAGMDLKKGEVTRKIKLDPKYGQGEEKEQKIGIGKVIAALKISEDKKKKYLNWLALYKDNLEKALDESEYAIVLSRAPIDVIRMSDHRNISSCHSQGGSYFHCAVQEAISGGAVAYVIRREDINALDSLDELQAKEFFPDSDRNIRGVRGIRPPLARLRIRRLESQGGDEIAIPDERIYGDQSIPGFREAISSYLRSVQPMTIEDFNAQEWNKRGGTYYDDRIEYLANKYFEDGDVDTKIRHDRDDSRQENNHASMGLEEELEEIKNAYTSRLTYSEVDYYMDHGDEQPYADVSGGCEIDISKFGLPDDADISFDDEYEVRKAKNGKYDDDYTWSVVVEYLLGMYRGDGFNSLSIDNKKISISFYHEDMVTDDNEFDRFCDHVLDFDKDVEDMLTLDDGLLEVFTEAGLLTPAIDKEFSRLEAYRNDDADDFNSFTIDGYKGKTSGMSILYSDEFMIIPPNGDPPEEHPYLTRIANPSHYLQAAIWEMSKENFHPKVEGAGQMEFQKFFESYTANMDHIDFRVKGLSFRASRVYGAKNNPCIINSSFNITLSTWDDKMFEWLDFLDEMAPHVKNLLILIALDNFKTDYDELYQIYAPANIQNLEKVYRKYLQ